MIAAIMQPYFFPYIGYFQLMQAVDTFVFFDDVQYINRGWVNRNRIRSNNTAAWLTFPVCGASRTLPINERHYDFQAGEAARIVERRLYSSYSKAPCWSDIAPLISSLLGFEESNVAIFNCNLIETLARHMGIECRLIRSSSIDKPGDLKGSRKVIDLCQRIGASHYVNPIGGTLLYRRKDFEDAGIKLSFLRTRAAMIQMGSISEHLSVIDVMMHQGIQGTAEMLHCFDLVD